MADDVEVKFGASIEGLKSGVAQASGQLKDFADKAKEHSARVAEGFSKIQEGMIAIAAVAAGGAIFKEFVSSTLETISGVQSLQKSFGLTLEEANLLKTKLDLLRISTSEYKDMASMLDRQLKSGNETLTKMGLTSKDLALGQQGLMDKAIKLLGEYKEGVDRNIAAQVLFGRGGSEAVGLVKLGLEGVTARAKELEHSLGLTVTDKNKADALAYKVAVTEIGMAFDGIKKAIGENVLPYLTRFAQWATSVAPTVIGGMKGAVTAVVDFVFSAVQTIGMFVIGVSEQIEVLLASLTKLKAQAAGAAGGASAGAIGGFLVGGPIGAFAGAIGGGYFGKLAGDIASGTSDVNTAATDFDKVRKKFQDSLTSFRSMLENGPASASSSMGKPPPGTKSAEGLIGPQGAGDGAALKAMQGQLQILQAGLDAKKAKYDIDLALFTLSEGEKVDAVRRATEDTYQAELAVMQKTLALSTINAQQRQSIEDKIAVLKQKHLTDNLQLELQTIQIISARYTEFFGALQGSFNGQLRGLLAGTTSWKNAFKTILGDMVIYFIEMVEKMVLKWAAGKLTMLAMDKSTALASAATEAASTAASGATAIALIQQKVAEVFAGAAAFFAPTLGPGAPAAAAGVAASVDATATGMAVVGSAETGAYEVTPGLWQLHEKETVLPAPAAQAFRDMAEGGGGFGGKQIVVHAIDAQGVASFFRRNAALGMKIFGDHAALNRG